MAPDSRGELFGRGSQPVGVMGPQRLELAVEESKQIVDDLDVAQSQLVHGEGFGASARAARAAGLPIEDLTLASEPGATVRG
jgi:hypothetical protein